MSTMKCLRCGGEMKYYERMTLRKEGLTLNHVDLHENLDTEIFFCPLCGKIEFFSPEKGYSSSLGFSHPGQRQRRCGHCGQSYDADYPKCPWCAKENEE